MLEIKKEEPEFFSTYKKKNRPHSYQDDCNDYRLRDELRETLLIEQNSQCFYCEKKIKNDSKKVHIDHLKQRDFFQYISNGEIKPKASLSIENIKRASNTIEYLNLNHKDLVEARKNIILNLELYKQSSFNINDIFAFFNEFENLFKD